MSEGGPLRAGGGGQRRIGHITHGRGKNTQWKIPPKMTNLKREVLGGDFQVRGVLSEEEEHLGRLQVLI